MPKPTCDICGGSKRIRLPLIRQLSVEEILGDDPSPEETFREFDCPNCTKLVPFRRVRAMRVVAKVDYERFGKFQNPIERGLAEQFGAYLQKEGLIKFGASNLEDPTALEVNVSAEINIVLPKDAEGAERLALDAEPPGIPKRLTREERERLARNGGIVPGYTAPSRTREERSEPVPWKPAVFKPEEPPMDKRAMAREAAAQRAGVTARFSGIDFGTDDFE